MYIENKKYKVLSQKLSYADIIIFNLFLERRKQILVI